MRVSMREGVHGCVRVWVGWGVLTESFSRAVSVGGSARKCNLENDIFMMLAKPTATKC